MPYLTNADLSSQARRVQRADELLRLPFAKTSSEWDEWVQLFEALCSVYPRFRTIPIRPTNPEVLDDWISQTAAGHTPRPNANDMRRMEESEKRKPGGPGFAFYRRWRRVVAYADRALSGEIPIDKATVIKQTPVLQDASAHSEEPLSLPSRDSSDQGAVPPQHTDRRNAGIPHGAPVPALRPTPPLDSASKIKLLGRRIFISHSSKDNEWCHAFAAGLREASADVWYDASGLHGGVAWVETIEREIESRELFLALLTPQALESEWVKREIQLAFAAHRTVVPVLLAPTPVTGFMRIIQYVDVTGKQGDVAAQIVALHLSSMATRLPDNT